MPSALAGGVAGSMPPTGLPPPLPNEPLPALPLLGAACGEGAGAWGEAVVASAGGEAVQAPSTVQSASDAGGPAKLTLHGALRAVAGAVSAEAAAGAEAAGTASSGAGPVAIPGVSPKSAGTLGETGVTSCGGAAQGVAACTSAA